MYGASIANICIVNITSCTNQACCVLGQAEKFINLYFAKYALQASKDELLAGAKGGTQPNISQEIIKNLFIPVPPLPEQKAIAEYLDKKCAAIDEIITEKEILITDLKLYKKSLIYETVTGKRKV